MFPVSLTPVWLSRKKLNVSLTLQLLFPFRKIGADILSVALGKL